MAAWSGIAGHHATRDASIQATLHVQGSAIGVLAQPEGDYISLTDMVCNVDGAGALIEQWCDVHPAAEGNMRDNASLEQLVVLTNLESLNSVPIRQSLPSSDRLRMFNEIAITQMRTLLKSGLSAQLE